MQARYRSKVDLFIACTYLLVLIPLVVSIYQRDIIASLIFAFICLLFPYLYLTTVYLIKNDRLMVSVSFIKRSLSISEIKTIERFATFQTAPAFSILGRILISYGQNESLIISPVNLARFCAQLKAINPGIEIK